MTVLLILPFQPKFYPLITICLFFPSFFSIVIDNCYYGNLLRKCLKKKIFFTFYISFFIYYINVVKKILPQQLFAVEHADFLLQEPRQLPSGEANFEGWRSVFRNVNLSNLENLLQRNVRTGRVRECIFRASGDNFFPSAPIMVAPLWVPCPWIYQSVQQKPGCVTVCIQHTSLCPPFYKKNLYDYYYWMTIRGMLPLLQVIYKEWRMHF